MRKRFVHFLVFQNYPDSESKAISALRNKLSREWQKRTITDFRINEANCCLCVMSITIVVSSYSVCRVVRYDFMYILHMHLNYFSYHTHTHTPIERIQNHMLRQMREDMLRQTMQVCVSSDKQTTQSYVRAMWSWCP